MAEQEYLSLHDLEQYEEALAASFNPEADANAQLPPIPKGEYVFTIGFQESDPEKRWQIKLTDSGTKYYMASITATVAENPANPSDFIGRRIMFHRISTLVFESSGTTSSQALIQGMSREAGDKLKTIPRTHQALIKIAGDLIANPRNIVIGEVDWVTSRYDKAKQEETFKIAGAASHPKDAEGNPIAHIEPDMKDTQGRIAGDDLYAKNFIRRWKCADTPAKEVPVVDDAPPAGDSAQNPSAPSARPVPRPRAAAGVK